MALREEREEKPTLPFAHPFDNHTGFRPRVAASLNGKKGIVYVVDSAILMNFCIVFTLEFPTGQMDLFWIMPSVVCSREV